MQGYHPAMMLSVCLATTCLYSYALIRRGESFVVRALLAAPIVALYFCLPVVLYDFQTAALPIVLTACIVSWLSSFKLILLVFQRGPLADPQIEPNLLRFCAILCFPLNLRSSNSTGGNAKKKEGTSKLFRQSLVKVSLLQVTLRVIEARERLHPQVYHFVWYFNLYFFISLIMELSGAAASWILGVELLPDFNQPYLSASVSEFWSRRWNLTVSALLREAVYEPLLQRKLGPKSIPIRGGTGAQTNGFTNGHSVHEGVPSSQQELPPKPPAIVPMEARATPMLAAFVVSGIMHELIYWYMLHTVSGEVMAFFVLHGVAVFVERGVSKYNPWLSRVPLPVRVVTTVAFCFGMAEWLFLPPLVRSGIDVQLSIELQRALFI